MGGPSSNPRINVSKPQKRLDREKVPYKFSMRQIYHIRGRYGKYFWAVIGSAIFISATVPPVLWARRHADKQTAQKLIDDPKLLKVSGIKREHLPKGVAKQLE